MLETTWCLAAHGFVELEASWVPRGEVQVPVPLFQRLTEGALSSEQNHWASPPAAKLPTHGLDCAGLPLRVDRRPR